MTTFVLVIRIVGNAEERPMNVNNSTSAEALRRESSWRFSVFNSPSGYVSNT